MGTYDGAAENVGASVGASEQPQDAAQAWTARLPSSPTLSQRAPQPPTQSQSLDGAPFLYQSRTSWHSAVGAALGL